VDGVAHRPEPRVVADIGGFVVAEDGPVILLVDRGIGPLAIMAFVSGTVALVAGGFGIVVLASGSPQLPLTLGLGLVAIGLFAVAGAVAAYRAVRGVRARSLREFRPVAVFDRAAGVFVDGWGQAVAPLHLVRFERRLQITSSSPKLVAVTPYRTVVLASGNPFAGGIGNLDAVLTGAVHGR
jgi:hypothetical protein